MLYLLSIDDSNPVGAALAVADSGTLTFNGAMIDTHPDYANFGKMVTVIRDSFNSFTLGKGLAYAPQNLLYTTATKPHIPSFFMGLEDIIKPSDFRMKYITIGQDVLIFFTDDQTKELFLHERLAARAFVFNDKNDRFNCTIFQGQCQVYLSGGLQELTLDVSTYGYYKLNCNGATIAPTANVQNYQIEQYFQTDASPSGAPVTVITEGTDTYKLTFPGAGDYVVQVTNDSFFPVSYFFWVRVC